MTRSNAAFRVAVVAALLLVVALPSMAAANGSTLPHLPAAAATCPEIREGRVAFGGVAVQVVVAGARGAPGPLILYWHGTGTDPLDELERAFDVHARRELRNAGGTLVAFLGSTSTGPTTSGNGVWHEGDLVLADEVVACAVQHGRVDPRRIHAMGMSAGGLHVATMSYRRAQYLASVVTVSGGHLVYRGRDGTNATSAAPDNRYAALIIHGGDSDDYTLDFDVTSRAYAEALRSRGHEALLCSHGQGHRIPAAVSAAAWRFFQDHAFGSGRSYEAGRLPPEIAALCASSGPDATPPSARR